MGSMPLEEERRRCPPGAQQGGSWEIKPTPPHSSHACPRLLPLPQLAGLDSQPEGWRSGVTLSAKAHRTGQRRTSSSKGPWRPSSSDS